jgi:feruloyl-CoA synthase
LIPRAEKLELCYRGPNVTPGYWRSEETTREAFDAEGFFHSGDAVLWRDPANPDAGLVFEGRLAEDFKLDTGTWVHVNELRTRAINAGTPYVQDVVIAGLDRAEVGLLIVPDFEKCRELACVDGEGQKLFPSGGVRAFFQKLIDTLYAEGAGSTSRVARALVLDEPLSLARGEITDKGTVNQHAVLEHRAALVEQLYAPTPPPKVLLPQANRRSAG